MNYYDKEGWYPYFLRQWNPLGDWVKSLACVDLSSSDQENTDTSLHLWLSIRVSVITILPGATPLHQSWKRARAVSWILHVPDSEKLSWKSKLSSTAMLNLFLVKWLGSDVLLTTRFSSICWEQVSRSHYLLITTWNKYFVHCWKQLFVLAFVIYHFAYYQVERNFLWPWCKS